MPFRGRPSAGCQTCRRRKIKCDLRKGGCEKCAKAGWACEGYRDVSALLFRDETDHVKRKVKAKQRVTERCCNVPETSRTTPQVELDVQSRTRPELVREVGTPDFTLSPLVFRIQPDLEDLSLGYFFSRYVLKSKHCRDNWNLDDDNGCLLSSIKALGSAGVTSQSIYGPSDGSKAQELYIAAIGRLNAALRSPKYVRRDSTLLAINILGVFESVNGLGKSLEAWKHHIDGAASLLQLRGAAQFETQTGCRLFLQSCSSLVTSCLIQHLPVPAGILSMRLEAEKHLADSKDVVWRFLCAGMDVADLNASLSLQSPREAVSAALDLFDAFRSILEDSPADWKPQTVSGSGPTVFSNYYYIFDSYIVAQIFAGTYRYRLHLIDIISNALQHLDINEDLTPDEFDRANKAQSSIRELQLSILACVPQHLCDKFQLTQLPLTQDASADKVWSGFTSRDHSPFRGNTSQNASELPFVRIAGGYMIQFPLCWAGAADPPGGDVRMWVIKVLRLLGTLMGVSQALVLAGLLERGAG